MSWETVCRSRMHMCGWKAMGLEEIEKRVLLSEPKIFRTGYTERGPVVREERGRSRTSFGSLKQRESEGSL
jgi:hypothetical protein